MATAAPAATDSRNVSRLADEPPELYPVTFAAVAAAIEDLEERPPRADRHERDERFYRACVRLAYGQGNPFTISAAALSGAAGYNLRNASSVGTLVWRALRSLEATGLIEVRHATWRELGLPGPAMHGGGGWACLRVRVIFDASASAIRTAKLPSIEPWPGATVTDLQRLVTYPKSPSREGCRVRPRGRERGRRERCRAARRSEKAANCGVRPPHPPDAGTASAQHPRPAPRRPSGTCSTPPLPARSGDAKSEKAARAERRSAGAFSGPLCDADITHRGNGSSNSRFSRTSETGTLGWT